MLGMKKSWHRQNQVAGDNCGRKPNEGTRSAPATPARNISASMKINGGGVSAKVVA